MAQPNRVSHTPTPTGAIAVKCGRFELVAKVGHGGMADVFLGVAGGTAGFRKLTVVKRMHPELLEEGDFMEMFLDEARLAARLNHQNIVQTQEVDTAADGVPYIAMEFLEGQSLDKVIREALRKQKPLPLSMVVPLIAGVLDALSYAHTLTDYDGSPLGVVHRDVSPSNLFVTYDGTSKLLDFGIAKAATQVTETQTGQIKGKFSYMAPEQARGEQVDGRADLWSMGVVLWECVAGRRLFKEANHIDTIRRVLSGDVPPLETVDESVPEAIIQIVEKALQVNRAYRWESAAEMRDALTEWQRESGFQPASKHEISRFMRELFADRIASQQEQIRLALESFDMRESMSTERALLSIDDSVRTSQVRQAEAPKGQSRIIAFLAGALLLTGGVLAGTMLVNGNRTERRAEEPTARQPVEAASGQPDEAPATAPVAVSEMVQEPVVDEDPAAETGSPDSEETEETEETEEQTAEQTARRRRWRTRTPTPAPVAQAEQAPTPQSMATAERAERQETGRLSIVTTPWSEVYLGSRRIGQTPLIGLELPAGRHVLTLRNPEEGIETRYPVTIEAEQHERVRISLR